MATVITSDCINCGACEPECPNTAIYAGGVQWDFNGVKSPAISQDLYYIVPSKCTECVGFFDHEACAAVCPVDCCVPDPKIPETEEVLIARARELHPELTIGDDFASRFRKSESAPAKANGADEAPSAVVAALAVAPKPAAPIAPAAPAIAAPVAMLNLPKDIGTLPGPIGEKHFKGELEEDFETVLRWIDHSVTSNAPAPVRIALRLAEPILGAMSDGVKASLEKAVGNLAGFSRARSTALNIILNLILYPAILVGLAAAFMGDPIFSQDARGWIALGALLAGLEACWRLREGIFGAKPADELTYRAAFYGILLAPLGSILARSGKSVKKVRKVAFDGFRSDEYDEKTERDRRYGTVYTVSEAANAYLVRLELPRKIPASSLKRLWGLPDEMPDYDYNIALTDSSLLINGGVRGEALRRLSYISPSFPADFTTRIDFNSPVSAFKHRLRNKVLEIVVFKSEVIPIPSAAA
jgi:ferredoxin